MAIWTEKEIRESIKTGGIEVTPMPEISDVSINLHVDKVFSLSLEEFIKLLDEPYKVHDPFEQGRIDKAMNMLGLEDVLSREVTSKDGRWHLKPNKHVAPEPYVVRYKERFSFNEDVRYSLTKRSHYARCGMAGFSQDIIDGYFYDTILCLAGNVIYEGDEISQLTLYDPDTSPISQPELAELLGTEELKVYDEPLVKGTIDENDLEITAGIVNGITDCYISPHDSFLTLRLHDKIKAFQGNTIDRKNFKPEDFVTIDLSIYNQIYTARFVLGRTRENQIRPKLCRNCTQMRPHTSHKHMLCPIYQTWKRWSYNNRDFALGYYSWATS